jgi:carbon storage regulator CsrA
MLVLSRRLKEKIVLPKVATTIQIVSLKKGVVRLGVEAPPEMTILREEVFHREPKWARGQEQEAVSLPEKRMDSNFLKRMFEELQSTGMALGVIRLELDAGRMEDARLTLRRIQDQLQVLRFGIEGEIEDGYPRTKTMESKTQRALLVEDDSTQRELLAGFLRQSGLNVDTARDGSDALDYLGSHEKPDFVLLDMAMPRVDGPTVVRKIRSNPAFAGLKIFGVTASAPETFDLQRGPQGVDRWFQKPFDPCVLLEDMASELQSVC